MRTSEQQFDEDVLSPLTGGRNIELVDRFGTEAVIHEWQQLFGIDAAPYLRGVDCIEKFRCLDSQLVFFLPKSCAGPAELYRKLRGHSWYYLPEKWEYDAALAFLPAQGRVLEVGGGDGHFFRKAARPDLQLEGLEMTPPRTKPEESRAWSISEGSVEDHVRSHPQSYDAVCSFQVLEHVVDPLAFLDASVRLLATDGILIVATPNARSFLRHARNILDMPPHHMTGWSEDTYRFLESILPVRLEKVLFEPLEKYHVDYFLRTYGSRFPGWFDARGAWARGIFAPFSRAFLQMGGRHWARGQSMLAVFRKTSGEECGT